MYNNSVIYDNSNSTFILSRMIVSASAACRCSLSQAISVDAARRSGTRCT